jgi:hypothetical protein
MINESTLEKVNVGMSNLKIKVGKWKWKTCFDRIYHKDTIWTVGSIQSQIWVVWS